MESAIEEELQSQAAMVQRVGPDVQVNGSVVEKVSQQCDAFGPKPDGNGEEKCHEGGVAEQVELVGLPTPHRNSVGFCSCRVGEDLLGDDVLRDEEDCAAEGVDESKEVGSEAGGASQNDTQSQRNQREIGGHRISDIEEDAICHDGHQRRKTLDGVDQGHGDHGHGIGIENVAANLKGSQRQGRHDDLLVGSPNSVLEDGQSVADRRIALCEPCEEDTPKGHEGELDDGQGYGHGQRGQDGLGRGVGDDGRHVPKGAEALCSRIISAGSRHDATQLHVLSLSLALSLTMVDQVWKAG